MSSTTHTEEVLLGAGCFWGVEAAFRKVVGVLDAPVGYAGGTNDNPTYEEVCTGQTGHAEVIKVTFDPQQVSFTQILHTFWAIHDPTTPNRQGPDVGTQYRSVIFYTTPDQREQAEQLKHELDAAQRFHKPIVTEILPAPSFWHAEEYHQRYFEKHPSHPNCHFF